jgi:hypothetical protein
VGQFWIGGNIQHQMVAAHDREEGGGLLVVPLFAPVSASRHSAELASCFAAISPDCLRWCEKSLGGELK